MTRGANGGADFYNNEAAAKWLAELPIFTGERIAFEQLRSRGITSVSDVGSGAGRLLNAASSYGFSYRASDPAAAQIAELLARHPRTDAIVADGATLPWATGSTDAVLLMFHVLESVLPYEHRLKVLREACRVLQADGLLVFSCHRAWRYRLSDQLRHSWKNRNREREWGDMVLQGEPSTGGIDITNLPMHLMSNRELRRLARESGFRIISTHPMKRRNTFWGRVVDNSLIHMWEVR